MTVPPDPREAVSRWLRFASEDLADASALLSLHDRTPRNICTQAQQSAEKALKSVLIYAGIRFPKVHDLEHLVRLIPEGWEAKSSAWDLEWLSTWSGQGRYPGDLPEGDRSDAERAVHLAEDILDVVTKDMVKRGFEQVWKE